jgi:uncharacterized protein YpmS
MGQKYWKINVTIFLAIVILLIASRYIPKRTVPEKPNTVQDSTPTVSPEVETPEEAKAREEIKNSVIEQKAKERENHHHKN